MKNVAPHLQACLLHKVKIEDQDPVFLQTVQTDGIGVTYMLHFIML